MTALATTLHADGGLFLPPTRSRLVHDLPAEVKVVAAVLLVGAGVSVPTTRLESGVSGWLCLFLCLALALLIVAIAGLPWKAVARRMVVELPFVLFALAMPFVALGERVTVLGIPLSVPGLVGAGAVLVKATTGVLVGIVLAATTTPHALLHGLRRLRVPAALVAICSFMIRYASVVFDDLRSMRVAREARGYLGGGLGHLRIEAAGVGTLFVRSYERGERVHKAMLARGYVGSLPMRGAGSASGRDWLVGLALPVVAVLVCFAGWLVR